MWEITCVFERDCVILRDFDSLFEEFSWKLVSRRSLIRSSLRCALEFEENLKEKMSNSKKQPNVERNMEEGLPVDWVQPEPAPLVDRSELLRPSLYRAIIAEFVATLLFVYVGLLALMGVDRADGSSSGGAAAGNTVGLLGVAWAFGGAIFIMVYCIAGISGSV
jgi:hypothetical protein